MTVLRTLRSLAILNHITYARVPSWKPGGAGSGISGGMEGQHLCKIKYKDEQLLTDLCAYTLVQFVVKVP